MEGDSAWRRGLGHLPESRLAVRLHLSEPLFPPLCKMGPVSGYHCDVQGQDKHGQGQDKTKHTSLFPGTPSF